MSKMEESIKPIVPTILAGTLLAIDPSSGSRESQPGYAIFKAGVFIDSGTIKITAGQELHKRLFILRETLCTSFEAPDVLVTENVPPIMGHMGFNKSIMSLQKAIGVTISCFDRPLVEVAPISWRKYIPENYKKSDEVDAIMMGITVLTVASQLAKAPVYQIEERVLKRIKGEAW